MDRGLGRVLGVFTSILLSLSPTPYQILLLEAGIESSGILALRKTLSQIKKSASIQFTN